MSPLGFHKKFQVVKEKEEEEEDVVVLALLIRPALQSTEAATLVVRCTCHTVSPVTSCEGEGGGVLIFLHRFHSVLMFTQSLSLSLLLLSVLLSSSYLVLLSFIHLFYSFPPPSLHLSLSDL